MKQMGYPVESGYMGLERDGKYHLFASEQDYKEYIEEEKEEENDDRD
jgi:hypothetical protein